MNERQAYLRDLAALAVTRRGSVRYAVLLKRIKGRDRYAHGYCRRGLVGRASGTRPVARTKVVHRRQKIGQNRPLARYEPERTASFMGTEGSLRGDLSTTDVARQLHAVNSVYTLFLRGNAPPDLAAIPAFDAAPPYQRDTFVSLSKKIVSTPQITPPEVHQEWINLMKANGWTRGTLNEHSKTHPLLVPYADLPTNEQIRAALFIATVQGVRMPIGERQTTGVGAVVDGY